MYHSSIFAKIDVSASYFVIVVRLQIKQNETFIQKLIILVYNQVNAKLNNSKISYLISSAHSQKKIII